MHALIAYLGLGAKPPDFAAWNCESIRTVWLAPLYFDPMEKKDNSSVISQASKLVNALLSRNFRRQFSRGEARIITSFLHVHTHKMHTAGNRCDLSSTFCELKSN